jgi:hypothetical protein
MGVGLAVSSRTARAVLVTGTAAIALLATVGTPTATASTAGGEKQVSYLGLEFNVPAAWPVITVSAGSDTCVRFDQHAVYLGTPGQNENCPTGLVGRTEALLVQPAATNTTGATSAVADAVSHQITVTTGAATVTATYHTDATLIDGVLAGAGLPTSTTKPAARADAVTPNANPAANPAALPTSVTNGSGLGFDACSAPNSTLMGQWKSSSPYSAVGIYIGGQDGTCAQPNLTPSWVSAQASAGWHFLPTYVGPQADFGDITAPTAQGTQSADDAAAKATALGFGPGNVIYYDMEAYPVAAGPVALAFEAAWNAELHKDGYWSGIYGSANSSINDLVGVYGGSASPDVVDTARWNAAQNTVDANLPAADWANHQRVHQYNGGQNESYGGSSVLNVDDDFLDVGVAGSSAVPLTSTYTPSGPTRLLDTRNVPGTAVGAGNSYSLRVAGGATGVPTDTTAVVLNVTDADASAGSYLSVYPDGTAPPGASNLNFAAGQVTSNLVTVPVTDGIVKFYNFRGTVDVIADLFGYYTNGSGAKFTPVGPTRLLDTRINATPIGAGLSDTLQVSGAGTSVPASATAVVLNVTAVDASAGSYLTVYPDGTNLPGVSNINFDAGQIVPNLVVVPVVNGKVDFYNFHGTVDVIADLFGYYANGTGASFTASGPTRVLDTRAGTGTGGVVAPIGPDSVQALSLAGTAAANASAVVLNVTVTNPTAGSYLTVYPDGPTPPQASNLNYVPGQTVPNLVVVPVMNGRIDFYNFRGTVDVIADLFGYFTN